MWIFAQEMNNANKEFVLISVKISDVNMDVKMESVKIAK